MTQTVQKGQDVAHSDEQPSSVDGSSIGIYNLLPKDEFNDAPTLKPYTLPNGLTIYHQSAVQTNIIYSEVFEAQVYHQHGITLQDNACVFDVGAHIGLFSLYVHQVCKNAHVYAFEPGSGSYQALCQNLDQYDVQDKKFNYGLSSTSTSAEFVFFPYMSGMSGLFANAEKDKEAFKVGILHWLQENEARQDGELLTQQLDKLVNTFFSHSKTYTCQLKTLSAVMREEKIKRIDLLKIDVEGNEYEILEGIEKQDWPKIKQVVAEIHNKQLLDQASGLLLKRGYDVTIEIEEGEVLDQFESHDGYRLYMLYAVQNRRRTCGELKEISTRRHRISFQELYALLQSDIE